MHEFLGANMLCTFRRATGRTDGCMTTVALLCSTAQSRAKKLEMCMFFDYCSE